MLFRAATGCAGASRKPKILLGESGEAPQPRGNGGGAREEAQGMRRPGLGAERLIGLFLIGAVGFSPPVLTLFNNPVLVGGIPLLYLYLFVLWAVLVALAGIVVTQLVPNGEAKPPAPANEELPPLAGPRPDLPLPTDEGPR